MTRTTAREIAMHLIYEMEYHDELPEELFEKVFEENYYPRLAEETDLYQEKPNAKQLQYIEDCVRGVYVKKQEIDQIIETYAVGWKVSRISKVSLAVLRLAIYEIMNVEDAPTGAVINEAVEIARRYEEEDKVSFINGILGSYARAQEQA
jgi:N utilization substance protein B